MVSARGLFTSAVIVLATPIALGHHSSAPFDAGTVVNIEGTVTRFDFKNPHVYFYVESTNETGSTVEWEVESDWTTELSRIGWTADSLQPGDRIEVIAHPARNPQRHYMNLISLEKADGTVLTSWDLRPDEPPPPRAQATSIAGRWLPDYAFLHFFELMSQLANEKGRAAKQAFVETESPGTQCVPHPIPQRLGHPHVNDIEVLDDRIIITAETESEQRIIYLDGRGHPENAELTSRGHSIGHWEGDALVVETTQFAPHPIAHELSIPSGPQKRLTERYRLSEDRTQIIIHYTLEDPDYLIAPLTDTFEWQYAPHMDLIPYSCDPEVAGRYLIGEN
ncbi:MAG: DUF6152 family protein [Pseudomonadota bacterium]|nr:DUF6152 family protein [Pseudomonadota bacterium]